jgi:hypothetical protein
MNVIQPELAMRTLLAQPAKAPAANSNIAGKK